MEDNLKFCLSTIMVLSIFLLASCSWYKDLERSMVEGEDSNKKASQTVSREQYDKLLLKYEELSKKFEELKENPNTGKPSLMNELKEDESLMASVNDNAETVDVFTNSLNKNSPTPAVSSNIESQIELFRKAMSLKKSNSTEAMKIFQQLDSQGSPIIKTRAKFEMGELFLTQGQYDLSLQIFEDIISNHAQSGVVLMALKKAVVCMDKLNLTDKKEQYESMLQDVFETF
jgi:TolA-binding protein